MPPLTDNGLPYPPAGVTPNVPYDLEQLARALDPLMVDTGLVVVPRLAGFEDGPDLCVRRRGYSVELATLGNIGGTAGTFPTGLVEIVAPGGVPELFCPPENRWGTAFFSSNTIGGAVCRDDGSVAVVNDTGAARSIVQLTIVWLVEPPA